MLKKEEIFVNIQNESEYNKVIKLLRSFGQRVEMIGWEHIRCAQFYEDSWCVRFYGDRWCAIQRSYIERLKTEVSIQELKNILAFEFLKKGDVIIFSGGTSGTLWIAEFEHFTSNRCIGLPLSIKATRYNALHKGSRYQHSTSAEIYGSFVRFATDGEKRALGVKIDPDSELCERKAIPDITTHDIAKIERLHDYLIDAYNIHPSFEQLAEAREVISKLYKYTNHE